MDINQIFILLSQKGIENVNLEMLPFEQRKEVYEKYAELFKDESGKDATYITIKAYSKAKNFIKIKERLVNELYKAAEDKKYKYCYYCALLLNDDALTSFFEQFIDNCIDKDIKYEDFYYGLKKEMVGL